jgi:hypothetical protein
MYLCHKCSGVLVAPTKEHGLNECQCISGYYRGFEPNLTPEQAATEQVKRELEWLALFISQKRPEHWNPTRLIRAMAKCPHVGHGVIRWEQLAERLPISADEQKNK